MKWALQVTGFRRCAGCGFSTARADADVDEIVSWLEQLFNTDFLPSDVYYISDVTADVRPQEVITYGVSAFVITILATIYPAWRASRTMPAEALRYE